MEYPARITANADRDALARLLVDVPEARLAAVAQDLFKFLPLPARFSWSDSRAVILHIDALPGPPTGVPHLVTYAAHLAHEVDGLRSIEINRWVDAVGQSVGLDHAALRTLYQESLSASLDSSEGSDPSVGASA